MLNARFSEMAREASAPFLRASSDDESFGRTVEAFSLSARPVDGQTPRALEALGQEVARIRQHGFGEAELARAKLGDPDARTSARSRNAATPKAAATRRSCCASI